MKQKKIKILLNKNYRYFFNTLFSSFIKNGKRKSIFIIIFRLFFFIKIKMHKKKMPLLSSITIFKHIYARLFSYIFIKDQHVGSVKYKIPILSSYSSIALAKKWFLNSLSKRVERTLVLRLVGEIFEISFNAIRSNAIMEKKKYYLEAYRNKNNIRFLRYIK